VRQLEGMLCVSPFMAPTTAMITLGCSLRLGSLEFVANRNGEFGLQTTVAPLQAIRFGSLDFAVDDTGSQRRL
jgi:hypothetical protein